MAWPFCFPDELKEALRHVEVGTPPSMAAGMDTLNNDREEYTFQQNERQRRVSKNRFAILSGQENPL